MPKMMLISMWVRRKSELDFMAQHMERKGVPYEIRQRPEDGAYALYRQYKDVGKNRPPETLPSREDWDNR